MSTRSLTITLIFSALLLVGMLTYLFVLRPSQQPAEPDSDPTQDRPSEQQQDDNGDDERTVADEDDWAPPPIRGERLPSPVRPLEPEVVRHMREMAWQLGDTQPVDGPVRQHIPAEIAENDLLTTGDWRAVPILEEVRREVEDADHLERLDWVIEELFNQPYGIAGGPIFPHAWLDGDSGHVYVEAVARRVGQGPLSSVLTGPRGRAEHSLFEMLGTGWHLSELLAAMPLAETSPAARPQFAGDWVLYDGGSVRIRVRYRDSEGNLVRYDLEEFIELEGHEMPPTGWVYLAAPVGESFGLTRADEHGTIISLHTHPHAMLTNPWPSSRESDAARPHRPRVLPEGTPVQIEFVPVVLAERLNQRQALEPEWERFKDERRALLVEQGLEDRTDDVPAELPDDAGFDTTVYEFEPLTPQLTREELDHFERLVNRLANPDTATDVWEETLAEVAQLDSRYRPLLEEQYRDRREEQRLLDAITPDLLEQLSHRPIVVDGIYHWVGFAFDPERKLLIADANVSPMDGRMPLEFVICSMRGKHHESLFILQGHPYNIEQAFDMIGLERSSQEPSGEGDWVLYDGDFVVVEAAWRDNEDAAVPPAMAGLDEVRGVEGITVSRVEDLVRDGERDSEETMPRTGFAFVGSAITPQGVHLAEANGGVVAVYQRGEYAVLENPLIGSAIPHHYFAWRDRVPRVNWPVRLYFTIEPPEDRVERNEELASIWRNVSFRRPRIEVEDMPEDWRPHWRRGVWRYSGPDHAFLEVRPNFNDRNEREITPGYRDWYKERISFDNRNELEFLEEEDFDLDGAPAWRIVYRDRDGYITQRLAVLTRRFIYEAIFFVPQRDATVEELRSQFDEWLDRLDFCWPVNQISYISPHEITEVSLRSADEGAEDNNLLVIRVATKSDEVLPDMLARDIVLDLIDDLVDWGRAQRVVGDAFADEAGHTAWLRAGGQAVMTFHKQGEPADRPYFEQGFDLVEPEVEGGDGDEVD